MKKHGSNFGVNLVKTSFFPQHGTFDIAIIGGGVTGLGIARKAASQGFSVIVIEKDEIGSGASGNFHETLHSGARYAINDPISAKECYEENKFLTGRNSLVKDAIEATGGLFLALTDKDEEYAEELLLACQKIKIPVEEVNSDVIRLKEKRLTKSIKRTFYVPDGHINGKKVLQINLNILREYGATILTHHKVVGFQKKNDRIEAVSVINSSGETREISCGFIINAAGTWAGQIGKLAGVEITLIPYKGALIVFEEKLSNYVLNRCRKPSDGDIIVPAGERSILGTTSEKVSNIDSIEVDQNEIDLLLHEGEKIIPNLSTQPILRTYAGIRPLYASKSDISEGREISRAFMVINHREKDTINNFISVVGGKFMLYERMADAVLETLTKNLNKKIL